MSRKGLTFVSPHTDLEFLHVALMFLVKVTLVFIKLLPFLVELLLLLLKSSMHLILAAIELQGEGDKGG